MLWSNCSAESLKSRACVGSLCALLAVTAGRSQQTDVVEKVAGGFVKSEGPVWSKSGYLLFSDFETARTYKLVPPKEVSTFREHTNGANGNARDTAGNLYSCERDGRKVIATAKDGAQVTIADRWEGKKLNSPNDIVVRRDGMIYFTDPASSAVHEPQEIGFNGVYSVTPAGRISLVTRSMARPNGVALSPDGRILYVADSDARNVMAFDLDADGNTSRGREFINSIDGSPDGLRVAKGGNLYIACRGIAVYTAAGKFLRMIQIPEQPSNCAFGDPDLRTLYVTARTSLYRVRVQDTGALPY